MGSSRHTVEIVPRTIFGGRAIAAFTGETIHSVPVEKGGEYSGIYFHLTPGAPRSNFNCGWYRRNEVQGNAMFSVSKTNVA